MEKNDLSFVSSLRETTTEAGRFRVEAAERSATRDCETWYRYEYVKVCLTYVHAAVSSAEELKN